MVMDLTVSQLVGLVFGASTAGSLMALALGAVIGGAVRSFLGAVWPSKKEAK
jgi:hypothetical protein